MHNKYNNKSKNFIQGLRPFSSSIPKTLKKHLKKGGYNYSSIVDNWTKMVSKKISSSCYPLTVKMGKEMKNGTLILNVIHGKELEIEYKKSEIIDKINVFFGYQFIKDIKLLLIKEKVDKINKYNFSKEEKNKFQKKVDKINNENLKKNLTNLLDVFNKKK